MGPKNQLVRLLTSLTAQEKRHFRLGVRRTAEGKAPLYLRLFDHLVSVGSSSDRILSRQLGMTATQLANTKRRLYREVLGSLRQFHRHREIDLGIREQIDFAHLLYTRGLYLDALRLLRSVKATAVEHHRDVLHLEIIEFEKLIETRHITLSRQEEGRLNRLVADSARRSYSVLHTSELFNMNIEIHGRYILHGHSLDAEARSATEAFYDRVQARQISDSYVPVTFQQIVNRAHSNMWYHYIQLDFPRALEAAQQATTKFNFEQVEKLIDPDLYIKSLYYLHVFSYLTGDDREMRRCNDKLTAFVDDDSVTLNDNSRNLSDTYRYLMLLNVPLVERDYATAYALSRRIRRGIADTHLMPTEARRCLLRYKFAAACYGHGRVAEAVDHLNRVLNRNKAVMRDELIIPVRLLIIICHFDLGNGVLVDYELTNLSRFLRRSRDGNLLHRHTIAALRQLNAALPYERPSILDKLEEQLADLADDPLIQKALCYLDVREWIRIQRVRLAGGQFPAGVAQG